MPLNKEEKRKYQKRLYWRRKMEANPYLVRKVASSADVRAMRAAGLNPENIENEVGKVSSSVYYALMRDRDAIKSHLSWHHESMTSPDIGTVVERLREEIGQLQSRVTQLEASQVLQEAIREPYQPEEVSENDR